MNFFRRDFLFFLLGVLSLGLFGWMVRRNVKNPAETVFPQPQPTGDTLPDDFELPDSVTQPEYRLDDLVFRVDRKRKIVCAHDAATGESVWESQGEEQWIVPGAAFPMDISVTGELWVANVGRKRLEQLDPKTGRFIASWEPKQRFAGCCNPVRFAALTGGRFVTMEKGVRRACIYQPSGELESVVTDALSNSEYNYHLCRDDAAAEAEVSLAGTPARETIRLYDTGVRKHWEVR